MAAAQQHFNAVSAGLSSNEDGAEATLAGQMMACKNDISKAQTEAKQVNIDIKHYVIAFFIRSSFTLCFGSCYKMLKIIRSISWNTFTTFCYSLAPKMMKFKYVDC